MIKPFFPEAGLGNVENDDRSELGPSETVRLGGDDDDGVSRNGFEA